MKPVIIDKDKCIGCGKCIKDCVSEKLKLVDGKTVVDIKAPAGINIIQ